METYIKLYRKILDNPDLVKDNNAFIMFTKLLLKVDRKTGTYTAGRMQLATLCNMKPVTAYRTTLRLVGAGLVTALPNTKYTTYTVVNWDKYQSKKEKGEQLGNNLSHEPVAKVNTKQEEEKEKNIKDTKVSKALKPRTQISLDIDEAFVAWEQVMGYKITSGITKNRRAATNLIKSNGLEKVVETLQVVRAANLDKFHGVRTADFADMQYNLNKLLAWKTNFGKHVDVDKNKPKVVAVIGG